MSLPCRFAVRPWALALATASASLASATAGAQQQQTVVITGNPLGHDHPGQPASVLSGDGLALRRSGTLGETLDGLPGISASGFGPNSSRPVIRGLDGDRVRLLDNGGASIDASSLSFDHASASDPLVAERIEVLRGPAALLYGGAATGGVVNSIDNRIPRYALAGLSGRTEVRFGGPASERSGAAVLEGGDGPWAWHADVYGRQADNTRAPRNTPVEDGRPLAPTHQVRNSAARSEGGAIGGGWVSSQGYLGASAETTRNRYGTTADADVVIRMQRERLALAGEWRGAMGPLSGLLSQVTAQASHTRYQHQEVAGNGEIGTTFRSSGDDLRVQARHAPVGALQGVVGVQTETLNFSALGEEAFVPSTRTRSAALFALEELHTAAVVWSAGARSESVRVHSDGDATGASEARFGAAQQRRFTPTSAALSARLGEDQGWQASASLGHTERAPAYYELFANGLHVATGAYEKGDTTLPAESSRHAELGLAWVAGPHSVKANVFNTRFARFISLNATGVRVPQPDDSTVPEYAFRAVRARLSGVEIDGRTRLMKATNTNFALDLTGGLDTVRGDNLDTHEPLPRLAPLRLRAGLQAQGEAWQAGVGLRHNAKQTRVPSTDTATAGATLLDLSAGGALPVALGPSMQWFAKVNNATNRLAYSAATISTIRGLSPQAGRALTVGLRARF